MKADSTEFSGGLELLQSVWTTSPEDRVTFTETTSSLEANICLSAYQVPDTFNLYINIESDTIIILIQQKK